MPSSGEQPLRGKRVLITRAGEQSESFAQALRALGAQPLVAPTIAIRPLDDLSALDDALAHLSRFSWIVFTSQNGVDIFFARLAAHGATMSDLRVAAIGEQTAADLRRHGACVTLVADRYHSEGLARELIGAAMPGERMLLVRALEGREVLPQMLETAGFDVTPVAVYRTTTAQDPAFAEKVQAVDIVTFTSGSTVQGFSALLHGDVAASVRGKCVACIGPVTAEAARGLGMRVDVTATRHTVPGLVDALDAYYRATA
jgi:uroporphyrinogen III methyltransferase/synthase